MVYIAAAMILACPDCKTRYLVPAVHFAAGARTVRCGRCAHMWLAELPPEPAAALAHQLSALAPASDGPRPVAIPILGLPSVQNEAKAFWQNDWAVAGMTLVASILFLWLALDRRDIAERWPITESLYDRVGLHIYHAGEGLELLKVRSEMKFDGGTTQLTIEGEIRNKTDKPQSIPNLLAAAIGSDGKPIQSWQIEAPKATLAAGESVTFTSEIHAPQGTVVDINLHFIEPGNAS